MSLASDSGVDFDSPLSAGRSRSASAPDRRAVGDASPLQGSSRGGEISEAQAGKLCCDVFGLGSMGTWPPRYICAAFLVPSRTAPFTQGRCCSWLASETCSSGLISLCSVRVQCGRRCCADVVANHGRHPRRRFRTRVRKAVLSARQQGCQHDGGFRRVRGGVPHAAVGRHAVRSAWRSVQVCACRPAAAHSVLTTRTAHGGRLPAVEVLCLCPCL